MALTKEELAALQKMMAKAVDEIETKLATSLNNAIEGINTKVDNSAAAAAEIVANAKTAVTTIPNLIQEHIEAQLKTNITSIVEEVGKQFEAKLMEKTGGKTDGSLGVRDLLDHSDQIINVINAWKQPTSEQALMGQMNFIMKWHGILNKIEKGGGSGEELTTQISKTFGPEAKE